MKMLFAALLVVATGSITPAGAADVGVSINLGEPGFFGEIDLGNAGRPRVINEQPVVVQRRYRGLAPMYLRVPADHQRNWARYCDRYNACARPVYFVRDDWYRNTYAPRYRNEHGHDDRHDDRRDSHRDDGHGERHGDERGR